MIALSDILQKHPELAVFFCLAAGFWLGTLKFGRFRLGSVVGTLVVALVVGQTQVVLPDFIKTLFFSFFMFATGYRVGPQFFNGLRRGGLKLVTLSIIFCLTGLGLTLLMAKLFSLDKGFAAGLLSGALTQSSVIGTATDAINQLPLAKDVKDALAHHVPIGDAVTYLFGTIGPAIFLSKLAPRLMRTSLKAESEKEEEALGGGGAAGQKASVTFDVYTAIGLQAFRVTRGQLVGRTVSEFEKMLPDRCYLQQMRRGRKLFKPALELPLEYGDVLVISGHREGLIQAEALIGEEVVDPEAMEMPFEIVPVIVTKKEAIGKTVAELRENAPARAKGVNLRRIIRQGQTLPRLPNTRVERGDILELAGRAEDLEPTVRFLGLADRPTQKSDLIYTGIACSLGIIVGLISVKVGIISLSLGTSGGILVAGVLAGWFHSVYPRVGRIPSSAVWLMETLGLNVFIIGVGLAAGPHALAAMKSNGLQLICSGFVVTLVPHVLTVLVGRWGFKLNAGILLGASAGAGTATPALQAIADEADSAVPALGFTVPYALSNIILTTWGPVIVALVAS